MSLADLLVSTIRALEDARINLDRRYLARWADHLGVSAAWRRLGGPPID